MRVQRLLVFKITPVLYIPSVVWSSDFSKRNLEQIYLILECCTNYYVHVQQCVAEDEHGHNGMINTGVFRRTHYHFHELCCLSQVYDKESTRQKPLWNEEF